MAGSAYFAIKDAIRATRVENGMDGNFRLDSPATSAKIRMACEDILTTKVIKIVEKIA